MTEHNITLELDLRDIDDDTADRILDQLADYHPALGTSVTRRVEAVLTVEADSVLEAMAHVPLLLQRARDLPTIIGVEVTTTENFDARSEIVAGQHLLGVAEAASEIGITQQAASNAIQRGALHATRVGGTYVVPRSAAVAYRARRERRLGR